MIEWLKRLFHCHQWKIIREGNIINKGTPCGTYYDLQCSVCGKVKRRNLMA